MSTTTPNRSDAQTAASRANGSKSLGPTSPEGKAKVSHNRVTHGFRSSSIPLSTEDRPAYDHQLQSYLDRYNPLDQVEEDLVGLLAANMWNVKRLNSIESALFDLAILEADEEIHKDFTKMDEWGRLALAFRKSAGENAFELLRRYKSTAERAYHRALKAIEQLTKDRPKPGLQPQEIETTIRTQAEPKETPKSPEPPPTELRKRQLAVVPSPTLRPEQVSLSPDSPEPDTPCPTKPIS